MRKTFILVLATVFISGCAHAQITHVLDARLCELVTNAYPLADM